MKLTLVTAIMLSAFAFNAQAQEESQAANTSTANTSDLQKPEQKEKDIDDEITNARLRASLGAKSKFSFKSSLGYNGGSLLKPFDEIRPAYRVSQDEQALTGISGSIGMNYRATMRDNISLSAGLTLNNPFHGDLTRDKFLDPRPNQRARGVTKNRIDVANPSLGWSRGYKALGMQMITSAGYTHFTTEDATELYQATGGYSLGHTVLANMGKSAWQAGFSLSFGETLYKGQMAEALQQRGIQQGTYSFGLYPFAEYQFNDRFAFRTVFGYFDYTNYKADKFNKESLIRNTPYQSMGVAISVTRDIYLYPNVQFIPEDAKPERTNVALSTNINL